MKKRESSKIQSQEMANDIKRCKDVSEVWLQGGKARNCMFNKYFIFVYLQEYYLSFSPVYRFSTGRQ